MKTCRFDINMIKLSSKVKLKHGCKTTAFSEFSFTTQTIAEKMDLNTSITSSLWKDRAIVEMNIAIIHSFQVCSYSYNLYSGVASGRGGLGVTDPH